MTVSTYPKAIVLEKKSKRAVTTFLLLLSATLIVKACIYVN